MRIGQHEDWIDGLGSWEEVLPVLQDEWFRIEDLRQRLELHHGGDQLYVLERERRLPARLRRGLHRKGFRPEPWGRLTAWTWSIDAAVEQADLDAFAHPVEAIRGGGYAADFPRKVRQLRTMLARASITTAQAELVMRDVYRSSPEDLVVVLHREHDWWGEDEDDDDLFQLPTG